MHSKTVYQDKSKPAWTSSQSSVCTQALVRSFPAPLSCTSWCRSHVWSVGIADKLKLVPGQHDGDTSQALRCLGAGPGFLGLLPGEASWHLLRTPAEVRQGIRFPFQPFVTAPGRSAPQPSVQFLHPEKHRSKSHQLSCLVKKWGRGAV